MRWLFYIPKPRSRDGLLRRRPAWPRHLIRRGATPYARRRFDHAEVGQLAYHVTLIVLVLFGCRIGSAVFLTLSENVYALEQTVRAQHIDPPLLVNDEYIRWRFNYSVLLDEDGRQLTLYPSSVDSSYVAVFDPALPDSLKPFNFCADLDLPSYDALSERQRVFAGLRCWIPRATVGIIADRKTPADSVYSVVADAQRVGMRGVYFMGRETPRPR
ncbi:MAG: hypothetical protein AAFX41_08095 [Bacteroidota bacterium]